VVLSRGPIIRVALKLYMSIEIKQYDELQITNVSRLLVVFGLFLLDNPLLFFSSLFN